MPFCEPGHITAGDGGDTAAVEECRGRGSKYFRSGPQPPAPALGLGSASIHLMSGGGAQVLHTQSGQCNANGFSKVMSSDALTIAEISNVD